MHARAEAQHNAMMADMEKTAKAAEEALEKMNTFTGGADANSNLAAGPGGANVPEFNRRAGGNDGEAPVRNGAGSADVGKEVGVVEAKEFGFRFSVPAGFFIDRNPVPSPDLLYSFADRNGTTFDPATVLRLERMRGSLSVTDRISDAEFNQAKRAAAQQFGQEISLEETFWDGKTLDVFRSITVAEGVQFVGYSVQFPLTKEAVQLTVGGPLDRDNLVRNEFRKAVGAFEATNGVKLHQGRLLTTEERVERLGRGAGSLLVLSALAFIVIGGGVSLILRLTGNKSKSTKRRGNGNKKRKY